MRQLSPVLYFYDKADLSVLALHDDVAATFSGLRIDGNTPVRAGAQQEAMVKRFVRIVKAHRIPKLAVQKFRDDRSIARFQCRVRMKSVPAAQGTRCHGTASENRGHVPPSRPCCALPQRDFGKTLAVFRGAAQSAHAAVRLSETAVLRCWAKHTAASGGTDPSAAFRRRRPAHCPEAVARLSWEHHPFVNAAVKALRSPPELPQA